MSLVHWEKSDGISILTIQRPEVYNCLNRETLQTFMQLCEEIRHDRSTRVVIITGEGEKAFCSGADLKERRTFTEEQVRQYIYLIRETFNYIEQLPKPVIAAINGLALGGGMELALACDLRVADEKAVMGLTEVSLGIIPGAGGTQRLPRLIGKAKAKELIFMAQKVTAREAESIGLVNRVAPEGTVMEVAIQMAEVIKQQAPLSLMQAKSAIDQGMEVSLSVGLAFETKAYEVLIPTQDRLEGLAAFKEKRKPNYCGE